MECPYKCGWTGTPEEYSKHYETCPKRPRTPGKHSSPEMFPKTRWRVYYTVRRAGGAVTDCTVVEAATEQEAVSEWEKGAIPRGDYAYLYTVPESSAEEKCPNRLRMPGLSLSESSSPKSKVSSYVPGETFTIVYRDGIEGESIRLIEKLKESPTREYWLYEVVSDHSRLEGWFPKRPQRTGYHHSDSGHSDLEDFTKEQLEGLLMKKAEDALVVANREMDWVRRGVQRDLQTAKCNMYQYLERLLVLKEIADALGLKAASQIIAARQDDVKGLVRQRGWLP